MSLNKILTDKDRLALSDRIDEMFRYCPDMMSRKISEANVQQAFVLDTILANIENQEDILCVGSFEDSAMATLQSMGYENIFGIDPDVNFSLDEHYHSFFDRPAHYGAVFATSVIEHVQNDEEFLFHMCEFLKINGLGIITCDFNNEYITGASVPATVIRQYTRNDLEFRLQKVLEGNGCELVGKSDWTAKPDFIYQGYLYSFATFVFKRFV